MPVAFFRSECNIIACHIESPAEAVPITRAWSHVKVALKACVGDDSALLRIRRIRFIAPDHWGHILWQLRHQIGPLQNDVGPKLCQMFVLFRQCEQAIQEFHIEQVLPFAVDTFLAATLPQFPRFIAADM